MVGLSAVFYAQVSDWKEAFFCFSFGFERLWGSGLVVFDKGCVDIGRWEWFSFGGRWRDLNRKPLWCHDVIVWFE